MSLYDELNETPRMSRIWRGIIADNVGDFADRCSVIIAELDPKLKIDNCRWQSRDATSLPVRSDPCLVIFDNDRQPWVVAWWPFA